MGWSGSAPLETKTHTAGPQWSSLVTLSQWDLKRTPARPKPLPSQQSQIASESVAHPFESASSIVNQALLEHFTSDAPTESLPQLDTLIRQANKWRQGTRPSNPTSLDFDIQEDAQPANFLKDDIWVRDRRHLLFFTSLMLTFLTSAKEWYLDATFKSVGEPFKQLWSIHAFIKQGDHMKQVPLAYVIMSGRSEDDYVVVLRHLQRHFPSPPSVTTALLDFELAVWNAMRTVFPGVELRGCGFHWSQALWKHVLDLGLARAYMEKALTHKFIRRLFSLPFLPAAAIAPTFDAIFALPGIADELRRLLIYIRNTWITSSVWAPESWSVYNRVVRTNNDVEGWHRRLNSKIHRHHLPFYQLVKVLFDESTLLPLQAQLVSDRKLTRHQRTSTIKQQKAIFTAWERYEDEDITATGLLKEIASVYKPVTRIWYHKTFHYHNDNEWKLLTDM